MFSHFPQIFNTSPAKFYTLKTFEKSSKNSQIIIKLKLIKDCYLIESFFWLNQKSWLDI